MGPRKGLWDKVAFLGPWAQGQKLSILDQLFRAKRCRCSLARILSVGSGIPPFHAVRFQSNSSTKVKNTTSVLAREAYPDLYGWRNCLTTRFRRSLRRGPARDPYIGIKSALLRPILELSAWLQRTCPRTFVPSALTSVADECDVPAHLYGQSDS